MVAPMPPLGTSARPVLKTVTPLIASEASWAKLKARVPEPTPPISRPPLPKPSAPGTWRPLRVTMLYCGPKPRAVTVAPSPSRRSIEMPVMRCRDSARLVSGNLPMSSALIASTMPGVSRLRFIDWSRLLRMPVTTTVSSVVASSCAGVWANAGLMMMTPPTMVNIARDLKRFNLEFMDVSSAALLLVGPGHPVPHPRHGFRRRGP